MFNLAKKKKKETQRMIFESGGRGGGADLLLDTLISQKLFANLKIRIRVP